MNRNWKWVIPSCAYSSTIPRYTLVKVLLLCVRNEGNQKPSCVVLRQCTGSVYGLLTKCEVKMAGYWPSFFWVFRESSFNIYKGVGGVMKILKLSPLAFFRSPPPVGSEVDKFSEPPLIFSESPFQVSKNFRSAPQYLHPRLLSY